MIRKTVVSLCGAVILAGCSAPYTVNTPVASPVSPSPTSVPSYLLNQQVTQETIKDTICTPGWTKTVRPTSSYTNLIKKRQLPTGTDLTKYEEDHLIPLELGGAPKEERNLWPQKLDETSGATTKDNEENSLHRSVCAGSLTLSTAQLQMYTKWGKEAAKVQKS